MTISSSETHGDQNANDMINVMLVDDSAVIRGALTRILDPLPHIRVGKSIQDGEKAVAAAAVEKPDVIILDIEMPVMDGLTALPKLLQASPKSKVIMFSSLTDKGAVVTMKALQLGAVECIVKPSSAAGIGAGSEFENNFISIIEGLAPAHKKLAKTAVRQPGAAATSSPSIISGPFELLNDPMAYRGKPSVLAIGSSTGGPQALFEVLKNCTGFDVPILITQHMPATFTKILAEHITQHTGVPAQEGAEGMIIEPGKAYVAPGGFHMKLVLNDGKLTVKLDDGPQINFCKPAVDPMFESLIQIYGQKVLGVILTGMGSDGLGGGKALIKERGRLVAQDEATSVVWGMPGAVAQAGLCSQVLPLDQIGPWVKKAVMG